MKKTFTTSSYSLVLLACLLASVFSACPTFYSDYNLQGSSFQLCSSDNVPDGFNDRVSSFVIPSGWTAKLHGDYGFSGEFWGPYNPGTYNVPSSFNDKLSSVTVLQGQQGGYQAKPRCPTFYADSDLQGNSFQLCSSSSSLPNGWNDRISSFIIPSGFSVQLYEDNNYGGEARGPYTEGNYNIPSSSNDEISSIVINNYKDNDSNDDNSPNVRCPVFYADVNQRGASFQLCSSDNVPNGWNDRVSSFVVPAGYSLLLFPDYNYGGDQWGPYTEGVYNVPQEFNDQLSSVSISRGRNSNNDNDYNDDNNNNRNRNRDNDNDYNNDNDNNRDRDNDNNYNNNNNSPNRRGNNGRRNRGN